MRISDWISYVCSSYLSGSFQRIQRCPTGRAVVGKPIDAGLRQQPQAVARTVGVGAKLCMTEEGEIVRRKPFQKRLRLRVGDPVGVRPKERKSVVAGKSVSGSVDLGGGRLLTQKRCRSQYTILL